MLDFGGGRRCWITHHGIGHRLFRRRRHRRCCCGCCVFLYANHMSTRTENNLLVANTPKPAALAVADVHCWRGSRRSIRDHRSAAAAVAAGVAAAASTATTKMQQIVAITRQQRATAHYLITAHSRWQLQASTSGSFWQELHNMDCFHLIYRVSPLPSVCLPMQSQLRGEVKSQTRTPPPRYGFCLAFRIAKTLYPTLASSIRVEL